MNKQDAIDVLAGLGYSYFHDSVDERSLDETKELIKEHIRFSGDVMEHWERRKHALEFALEVCSDSELDRVLLESYGYYPSKVEGSSRAFFDKLLAAMSEAIKKRRCG